MKKIKSLGDFLVVSLGLGLMAFGCAGCASVPSPFEPGCTALDAAEIEARYLAEVVPACRAEKATGLETCKAAPAIREKYRALRADWERCGK